MIKFNLRHRFKILHKQLSRGSGFSMEWILVISVRLIGGNSEREGRVEVLYDDEWGSVCDDWFDENAADVLCRQLGYSSGLVMGRAYFGQSEGPIWLDDIRCHGNESTIFDCMTMCWGCHNCGHYEDVGVVCRKW